jgi:predicted acyltransferase
LFAVGNAMAFVMPRLQQGGDAVFWRKLLKRTILIFLIGFLINWFPFVHRIGGELQFRSWTWQTPTGEVAGVRILNVLQRIALCYFFASIIIYYAKPRRAFLISLLILLLYWALCIAGNPLDPYSLQGWFGTAIDRRILGEAHLYHGEGIAFDPEGLVSTLPAISQVILGYLVGDYIINRGKAAEGTEGGNTNSLYQTLTILFVAAVALLLTGYMWNLSFPINKKIWTSSYVVFTVGLAIIVLATLIYFIEVRQKRGAWSRFFDVFGKNPLFIYALSGLVPKSLGLIQIPNGVTASGKPGFLTPYSWFYEKICAKIPGAPENGSLFFAICIVLFFWAIAYWMDRKKVYLKV